MREERPVRIKRVQSVWASIGITAAFMVATIFLVAVPASRFTDPAAREYVAAVGRGILGFVAVLTIWQQRWHSGILVLGNGRAWMMLLPVAGLLTPSLSAFVYRNVGSEFERH